MSVATLAATEPVAGDDATVPVVIVGAGLAGLTVALQLADRHPIILLAKRSFDEAGTAWAQGGIVGVLGDDDSVELHVHDTQEAGAGLVDEHAAEFIAGCWPKEANCQSEDAWRLTLPQAFRDASAWPGWPLGRWDRKSAWTRAVQSGFEEQSAR